MLLLLLLRSLAWNPHDALGAIPMASQGITSGTPQWHPSQFPSGIPMASQWHTMAFRIDIRINIDSRIGIRINIRIHININMNMGEFPPLHTSGIPVDPQLHPSGIPMASYKYEY